MKYPVFGRTLALMLMIKRGNAVEADASNDRDLYFVNPCTGSFSGDERNADDDPCITHLPTPTQSFTPSFVPSNAPSMKITNNRVDTFECPGFDCDYDHGTKNDIITVRFRYTIETTSDVIALDKHLPALEERLLEKLAPVVLSHCMRFGDVRSLATNNHHYAYKRRVLNTVRRLQPMGICSIPADARLEETCLSEENESNNCFVVKGGVSVAIEEDDSKEKVNDLVLEAIKSAMDNGELLSKKRPDVKRVEYIGEFEDNDVFVDPDEEDIFVKNSIETGQKESSLDTIIFVGASFAAVAVLLAAVLFVRKRGRNVEDEDVSSPDALGLGGGSFIGPDLCNLAKESSAMDVHNCKSQTCTKCYSSDPLKFIPAELNVQGQSVKDNIHEVPSRVSSIDSDSNSVHTQSVERSFRDFFNCSDSSIKTETFE